MYPYLTHQESAITPRKAWMLTLLCAIWVTTGLTGHDPWKTIDAYSFAMVYHILQTGDWLIPTLAGQPNMDNPPLFYITAALLAQLFQAVLPLHDGARLACGLYMALTLTYTALAGRELFGPGRGWAATIILIGSLGLLIHAHQLSTDLGLLLACAMMIYGYTRSLHRPSLAGWTIGTGLGIGFMSNDFVALLIFLVISVTLCTFKDWRTKTYLTSLCIAMAVSLPWLLIWPYFLYQKSPSLFMEWAWNFNIGRWLEHMRKGEFPGVFYYLKT